MDPNIVAYGLPAHCNHLRPFMQDMRRMPSQFITVSDAETIPICTTEKHKENYKFCSSAFNRSSFVSALICKLKKPFEQRIKVICLQVCLSHRLPKQPLRCLVMYRNILMQLYWKFGFLR